MEIYVVSVGAKRHHKYMRKHGLRMLHLANSLRNPVDGISYALDNGAYHCWNNNKRFDDATFIKTIEKVNSQSTKPDFVVCPDIVAGGITSLEFSLRWKEDLPRDDYYLAVQDGMRCHDVLKHLKGFKGIFVGGTMEWKLSHGEIWTIFAHKNGIKCHIGRVGTEKRLLWARRIKADSVDSSTFPQGPPDMKRYKRLKTLESQTCFGGPCTGDMFVCNSCALNPNRRDINDINSRM